MYKYNKLLFEDEFVAWQFGPILPAEYKLYCWFGASDLFDTDKSDLPTDIKEHIDDTIQALMPLDDWELVEKVQQYSCWDFTYQILGRNSTIDNDLLLREFQNIKTNTNSCDGIGRHGRLKLCWR